MNFQTLNWTYEPVLQTQVYDTNSRAGCDQFSDTEKSMNKSNSKVEHLPTTETAVHESFENKPAQHLREKYLL